MNIIETKLMAYLYLNHACLEMTVVGLWKALTKNFEQALTERGLEVPNFVQDNHSYSQKVY